MSLWSHTMVSEPYSHSHWRLCLSICGSFPSSHSPLIPFLFESFHRYCKCDGTFLFRESIGRCSITCSPFAVMRQWELAGSSLSVARWEEVTLASGCSGVLPLACQMSAPQCGAEQRGNLGDWYLWGSLCRGVLAWEVPAGIGLRHSGSPRAPGGTLGTYAHLCHRLVALHQRPLLVCQARLGNRQSDVPGKLNQPNMISHCCCVVEGFHGLIQVAFCVVNWYMDFSALRCLNMLSCCWKNGARSFNNLVSWVRFVQLG